MPSGQHRSVADVLNELCQPGGQPRHSNTDLAKAVAELGGNITPGYLSLLRRGDRDNPTLEVLEHLATVLGVAPAVFVGGRRERRGNESPRATFSRKLAHLFAVVHPPDRGPWTPEDAAAAITARGTHGPISASYIRELLTPQGALPNPRLKHILGLAEQFRLSRDGSFAAYFLDDDLAGRVDAELADLVALRTAGVLEFFTRLREAGPTWRPELRQQVVDAFTQVIDGDETEWVFRPSPPAEAP